MEENTKNNNIADSIADSETTEIRNDEIENNNVVDEKNEKQKPGRKKRTKNARIKAIDDKIAKLEAKKESYDEKIEALNNERNRLVNSKYKYSEVTSMAKKADITPDELIEFIKSKGKKSEDKDTSVEKSNM